MSSHTKIRFPAEDSDGNLELETMWTVARDDGYEVDNIPFYVKGIAIGDVVSAKVEPDGGMLYTGLVRASGHSTIRILFSSEQDILTTTKQLLDLGCDYEGSDLPQLIAIDIPPTVPYEKVKAFLERGRRLGIFSYEEACLGFL